jgi:hypothetical protein
MKLREKRQLERFELSHLLTPPWELYLTSRAFLVFLIKSGEEGVARNSFPKF